MAIQIEPVPTRYQGRRTQTVRLIIGSRAFDLGLADTMRAIETHNAKAILRNLYDAAGAEPNDVEAFLDEVNELTTKAKEFTGWREPAKTDRVFGKRRRGKPTWRAN